MMDSLVVHAPNPGPQNNPPHPAMRDYGSQTCDLRQVAEGAQTTLR